MYEVFDDFLTTDTWYTTQRPDMHRFYLALDQVVWREDFDGEKLAAYMCQKTGHSRDSYMGAEIGRLADAACTVHNFLSGAGRLT